MPRRNDKTLTTLKNRLEIEFESEMGRLDDNINKLKVKHSARGILSSSIMLHGYCDLCNDSITALSRYYDAEIDRAIQKNILINETGLSQKLLSIFTAIIPEQNNFSQGKMAVGEKLANLRNKKIAKTFIEKISKQYQREIKKLSTDIDLHISSLAVEEKKKASATKIERLKLLIAIIVMLFGGGGILALLDLTFSEKESAPIESKPKTPLEASSAIEITKPKNLSTENTNNESTVSALKPETKRETTKETKCYSYVTSSLDEALKTIHTEKLTAGAYEGLCVHDPIWVAITQSGILSDAKTGTLSVRLKFYPSGILGQLTFTEEPPQLNLEEFISVTGRITRFRMAGQVPHPRTGKDVEIPASIHITGNAKVVLTQERLREIIYKAVAKVYFLPISSVKDNMLFEDTTRFIEVLIEVERFAECSIPDDEALKIQSISDFVTIAAPLCAGPV